jgi:hypothetical protein
MREKKHEIAHADDDENEKTCMYNTWFKQLRMAHDMTPSDVLQVLQFTEGQLKSKSVVRGWGSAEGSSAFVEMRKIDFCRLLAGLPMYMNRKRMNDEKGRQQAAAAEDLARRRKIATQRRLETMRRKKENAAE